MAGTVMHYEQNALTGADSDHKAKENRMGLTDSSQLRLAEADITTLRMAQLDIMTKRREMQR